MPTDGTGDTDEMIEASFDAIQNLIDAGFLAAAREKMATLVDGSIRDVDIRYLQFMLSTAEGELTDAETHIRFCGEASPEDYLGEYFLFLITQRDGENLLAKFKDMLAMGKTNLVADLLLSLPLEELGDRALLRFKIEFCRRQGLTEQALQICLSLPAVDRQPTLIDILSTSEEVRLTVQLTDELCRLLEQEKLSLARLEPFFWALVNQKRGEWQPIERHLKRINDFRFFHSLLRHLDCRNAAVESLMIEVRRILLLLYRDDPNRSYPYIETLVSIAIQNYRNEYVHYVDDEESQCLLQLDEALRNRLASDAHASDSALTMLATWLMYKSPIEIPFEYIDSAKIIASPSEELQYFMGDTIELRLRELELAQDFLSNREFADATSTIVANMYEENPFPRWTRPLTNHNPEAQSFPEYTGFTASSAWNTAAENQYTSMLVAGCGTGYHPLSIAVNFPWMHVTAIDLSARSLAYAAAMAERYAIRNVTLLQADILDLPTWDEKFDIVDAVGVLHHLEDVEAGLRALLTRLRPCGAMRLALYSTLAHELIHEYRANTDVDRINIDPEYIRRARHEIINGDENSKFREFSLRSNDFYSMSGCRDMLFHVHQTSFTIPEIEAMLAKYRLRFLGMGSYARLEPELRRLDDFEIDPQKLSSWHEAESRLPWLFASMYFLHLQRQD